MPVDLAIAAGALGAALDDVAGDGSGGEFIPIGRAPAEAVHHGGEGEGGVGGAAGDHDIRAGRERFGQGERSDVGVGAEDAAADRADRLASVHVSHLVAFGGEFVDAVEDVVTEDHGDFEAGRGLAHGLGAGDGVDAAGVGDDAHVAIEHAFRNSADERREIARVTECGGGLLLFLQDGHGDLGQVIEARGPCSMRRTGASSQSPQKPWPLAMRIMESPLAAPP